MSVKELAVGAVATVIIGGTAYTVNQADVVDNFAEDTGLTQEEAEQYVGQVDEDELVSFEEVGSELLNDGQEMVATADQIDCANYEYEWESATLSCEEGKTQIHEIGSREISLGRAYKKLDTDSASKDDISSTIRLIDELNSSYDFEITEIILDQSALDEIKKTNSYNKAYLKAALDDN